MGNSVGKIEQHRTERMIARDACWVMQETTLHYDPVQYIVEWEVHDQSSEVLISLDQILKKIKIPHVTKTVKLRDGYTALRSRVKISWTVLK